MTDPGPVITSLSHGSLAAPGGDCAARRLSGCPDRLRRHGAAAAMDRPNKSACPAALNRGRGAFTASKPIAWRLTWGS